VQVPADFGRQLLDLVDEEPTIVIDINVEHCTLEVTTHDLLVEFPLDDSVQHRLLHGLDDIGITLQHADAITAFEATRPAWMPSL
jgi:3-isopropylmalate/(R)-2-methylmalate dehydratase small subunit